jgi:Cytochrome c/c1 heme lyase
MGQTPSRTDSTPAGCPVPHNPAASCPVAHDAPPESAQCPIDHSTQNPRNQIPQLTQTRAPNQTIDLPLSRTESSIPREGSAKWEYPSPQQFYNALVRKGWETPEEHVETMVDIHNFLNERAWQEVLKWEKRQYKWVNRQSRFLSLYIF